MMLRPDGNMIMLRVPRWSGTDGMGPLNLTGIRSQVVATGLCSRQCACARHTSRTINPLQGTVGTCAAQLGPVLYKTINIIMRLLLGPRCKVHGARATPGLRGSVLSPAQLTGHREPRTCHSGGLYPVVNKAIYLFKDPLDASSIC